MPKSSSSGLTQSSISWFSESLSILDTFTYKIFLISMSSFFKSLKISDSYGLAENIFFPFADYFIVFENLIGCFFFISLSLSSKLYEVFQSGYLKTWEPPFLAWFLVLLDFEIFLFSFTFNFCRFYNDLLKWFEEALTLS